MPNDRTPLQTKLPARQLLLLAGIAVVTIATLIVVYQLGRISALGSWIVACSALANSAVVLISAINNSRNFRSKA